MIAGALASRATSLITTANPISPHTYRFAAMIKHYKVSIFKAGVTFLKSVMTESDSKDRLQEYDLPSTLRVGTFCAEPVNPTVHQFAVENICPQYINSYWGTEHGGMVRTQ